jgi:NTE family protein
LRGIVFSGGGSRGQFHVGIARELLGSLKTNYDFFGGVSVGALVAALLAQFRKGDEEDACLALETAFDVSSPGIYKRWWPFGMLHGLWNKPSFYDSTPLEKLVDAHFDVSRVIKAGKQLAVGCASITTGQYRIFRETDPDIKLAVAASAAMPAFFKPVDFDGQMWIDGGVREVTPIAAAIEAGCMEIDIVICQPKHPRLMFGKTPNAMPLIGRTVECMSDELVWRDLKIAELKNSLAGLGVGPFKVVKTRVFAPDTTLNPDALKFDRDEAQALRAEGRTVATRVAVAST